MSKRTRNDSAEIARCVRTGCECDSFNGKDGEYCCKTCRGGQACTGRFHVSPARKYAPCVRVGCPCTCSYDGVSGRHCCRTCSRGKKCEKNYHQTPSV